MNIVLSLDANASAAPAATKANWQTAATILGSSFTDNITVNLNVTYSNTGGGASAGPAGGLYEPYASGQTNSVYDYLTTHATPGDTTFAFLPNTATIGGASLVAVWDAQLKLMGITPTDTSDGTAHFATDISSNAQIGVALHEFAHAMGRVPFADNNNPVRPDIMEFFRFTAPGTRLFQSSIPGSASYFSLNGGQTASKWANYGTSSDPSDFLNDTLTGNTLDPFNEFYTPGGTAQYMLPADIEQMDALGYHPAYNTTALNAYDMNGDNSSDIVVQGGSGQMLYASMFNGTFAGWVNIASTPGFTLMGQGKISGNGSSDVVVENSSGQILYGNIINGTFSGFASVAGAPGFNVVGVADVNADHYADVVVESTAAGTGQILYANMNGGVFHNWVNVANAPGFAVGGVGDVNHDAFADVVIYNGAGTIDYVNMHNGVFSNVQAVTSAPGFKVVGVGDINRDGFADIVVQNPNTGQIAYANMLNGGFNNWVAVGTAPGFNVGAIEDVIGNGYQDVVVQNPNTGQVAFANMTTGNFQGWASAVTAPGFTVATGPANGAPASGAIAGAIAGMPAIDSSNILTAATTLQYI